MMQWSPMQEAIFDTGRSKPRESLMVVARAGSGKTTTLLELSRRLPDFGRMAVVAFAQRTKQKLEASGLQKHYELRTAHSMGLKLLRKHNPDLEVDQDKLSTILREHYQKEKPIWEAVRSLVKRSKTRLHDDLRDLMGGDQESSGFDSVGFDSETIITIANRVLFDCRERDDLVDFDDMIWLPVVLNLKQGGGYHTLFVDELQDLTRAQVKLCSLLLDEQRGGRAIGFGDPAQAIYYFAGADIDAVAAMSDELDAIDLPLSISYRCPQRIVQEAKLFVKDIEPHPSAPLGEVIDDSSLREVQPGSAALILSRTNAPLLGLVTHLRDRGIAADIVGRRLDQEMLSTIYRSGARTLDEFVRWLSDWAYRETKRIAHPTDTEDWEKEADMIADKRDSFISITRQPGVASVRDLVDKIRDAFKPTHAKGTVLLSTVHQMKGEEADEVFVLVDTFRIRRGWRKDPVMISTAHPEEKNLMYVAITRAKKRLHYVPGITK